MASDPWAKRIFILLLTVLVVIPICVAAIYALAQMASGPKTGGEAGPIAMLVLIAAVLICGLLLPRKK